jgi:hypothetical protein
MRKFIFIIFVIIFISCQDNVSINRCNHIFVQEIENYIGFIDTGNKFNRQKDFLYIEAANSGDTTNIVITAYSGAYILLNPPNDLINFIVYKDYNILFQGKDNNKIIVIDHNKDLKYYENIAEEIYPEEFQLFKENRLNLVPSLVHFSKMKLVFLNNKLIKKEFEIW